MILFTAPTCFTLLLLGFAFPLPAQAQQQTHEETVAFSSQILPLVTEYCGSCHSTEKQKGDLDLERFASLEAVRRHPKIWQSVAAQLKDNEMPPKDKPQLSPSDKARLSEWVTSLLDGLARERAGDPGPVVLRRLSNAEYTATIQDLTGVSSLDPAREFPIDGAAGEGFMNTGQALVMSPALVTKYLDAGKAIASHAVLLPDGIRFSAGTTRRDWTDEILLQIRAIYREFADPLQGEKVNLQGLIFSHDEGGSLPLERYFVATLADRGALHTEVKDAKALAHEHGLNEKYLSTLMAMLRSEQSSPLLQEMHTRWHLAETGDAAEITREIARWQKVLWKFNRVGQLGKLGGPYSWMEPLVPLAARQELELKIPAVPAGQDATLYLVASNGGDGNENDLAVWERPRLVVDGKPDIMLRDVVVRSQLPEAGSIPLVFGSTSEGVPIAPESIAIHAPSVLAIRVPAEIAAGRKLVVTGMLQSGPSQEGSVQFQLLTTPPDGRALKGLSPTGPVIVHDGTTARGRFEKTFDEFRQLFPAALCYTKIVPVDEVVTLTLFHREDDHFTRLMLDDTQKGKLDRLWDELRYVSQDALARVDAYAQLMEYATQDADPKVFEPLREPIRTRAAAFREQLVATESSHLKGVLEFAGRAYRRPLQEAEAKELHVLYQRLREQELSHEDSIRLLLARIFVSPAFLYRAEIPGPGEKQAPINDWELASRLSYFLWSSSPDVRLREAAAAGTLHLPDTLNAEMRRMLADPRARRLAVEFACQWLHIRDFDALDEKSERHFPDFAALRGDMYEEAIRFFTDLFQRDGSIFEILDADHAFVNGALAKHYGIPAQGEEWRRVDGLRQFSRGGVLGQAALLAKQSGASRSSPILRGNWVAEVLLGDKLPRPPKDVPPLPEEEGTENLTVRQLTEKHSSDPRCAGCHMRIDAFGFALENFDAIGRRRERDNGGRLINNRSTHMDGTELEDIGGLREYLLTKRRDDFLRQFCRKLLGYALGRGVQLSDEPLLSQMQTDLRAKEYRVGAAIEAIVQSRQFLDIRGKQLAYEASSSE